jgi:hypothetical protein
MPDAPPVTTITLLVKSIEAIIADCADAHFAMWSVV